MHLGDEELGVFSDIFGCAILVMPTDKDAFPVVHGDGPIGFEVGHCLSFDGAGHGAAHFELLRSWLPRDWLRRRGFESSEDSGGIGGGNNKKGQTIAEVNIEKVNTNIATNRILAAG